ncbi:carboxylic acid reductase [Nocardia sp. NPDC050697]|uniref:carboxylic acid reductase n=1 Tax=Nocardia sp. NPDC050697 TaxID=3155158 RepID=UPI0033FFEF7D
MTEDSRRARLSRRIAALFEADPQVRAAVPRPEVGAAIREPGLPLAVLLTTLISGYADRPALGARRSAPVTDPATGRTAREPRPGFDTVSYAELGARLRAVAAEWSGDPELPVRPGDVVALLGFTGVDQTVLDLAATYLGAVVVPLQAGAGAERLAAVVGEVQPRLFAVTVEQLPAAVECLRRTGIAARVVVFDHHADDDAHRDAVARAPIPVSTLAEVLARGAELPAPEPYRPAPGDDPLALLVYTSGSTGTPKGAMYPQSLVRPLWRGLPEVAAVTLHYLPTSHVLGRIAIASTLARGGTAYFTGRADLSTLFEDFAAVRPTELVLVPRIAELVFQRFRGELDSRYPDSTPTAEQRAAVSAELRTALFGDRALSVISGSAPIAPETKTFLEEFLDLELHDGYGSTEAGGGLVIDTVVRRPPVLEYRLADVPELGYFGTDRPHPRGELLVKTTTMIPGYYKRPELSAQIFDADGFYRTGDIVAETAPDRLVYVDRRNNVLKLAQGEFVTVANLEAAFGASPLVRQIFVYGRSERDHLLAVVVPSGAPAKAEILASLHAVAAAAGLAPYEIPRDIIVEPEPFSTANGLLSGIGKLLRPKLDERYGPRLDALYAELAREEADRVSALRRDAAHLPVLDVVTGAARALLGAAAGDPGPETRFGELGGDSLSALAYGSLLREIYDVEVPVNVLLDPAHGLGAIARYLERARNGGTGRPTAASIHPDPGLARAADLRLDRFLDPALLTAAAALPRPAGSPATVLLTGANGYLGRFLCLEWLERASAAGGTVICVIRAADPAAARARLDAAFDTGDAELTRRYRELAERALEVLPGNVGEPYLGLDRATWDRLAGSVDHIVHSAALVNHVLPYHELFGPNVLGTAEVLRLALATRLKPVAYLSTVGVALQVDPARFDEDADIREISAERVLDDRYASGYGTSKWAGEVLLREANDRCGLPATVLRSDMILAHSRYAGQLNVPDLFTRTVLSLAATGLAPASFYRGARGHYDGLPADFTAEAVTTLGAHQAGFRTFHVLNPHDDGISLDTVVDWLAADGVPITRVDGYDDWLHRFETALRALPEPQRRHSVLPLLHAYRRPAPGGPGLRADRFREAVRQAKIGPGHDIPHLTAELVRKYLRDLRALGLLE